MGVATWRKVTIQRMGAEDHSLKNSNAEDGDEIGDMRSKFVQDEGSEFVDFESHVATVHSEALRNEVCEIEWPPSDLYEQKKVDECLWLWLPKMIKQGFLFFTVQHGVYGQLSGPPVQNSQNKSLTCCLWSNCCIYNSYPNQSSILSKRDICLYMHRGKTFVQRLSYSFIALVEAE